MSSTQAIPTTNTTTAKGARQKAKQLLERIFDSDKTSKPDLPQVNYNSIQDLAQSFSKLSLPNPHNHRQSSNPEFVGGFAPIYTPESHPSTSPYSHYRLTIQPQQASVQVPTNVQRPPSMPLPYPAHENRQSLTMQMALQQQHEQVIPKAADFPTTQSTSATESLSLSSSYSQSSNRLPNPKRPRASSTPTTSKGTSTSQQCAGITKAGKQCSRQVKYSPALSNNYNSSDPTIERFCFQHAKELLEPTGFYGRKNGLWVDFDYWIPHYLQQDTQVALRVEMEKARSQSDVYGYIYTFEIREPHTMDTIKFKVGRAVNLTKRIDQWGKQCGSKEQILRGWYPGTVEAGEDEGSLMKGRVKAGKKGPWCHRLERLVHLELADLVATSAYLDPAWPKLPRGTKTSVINSVGVGQPCVDCGAIHKEIFELEKITHGRHKGKEWESVVKPIVERWGLFVTTYV